MYVCMYVCMLILLAREPAHEKCKINVGVDGIAATVVFVYTQTVLHLELIR